MKDSVSNTSGQYNLKHFALAYKKNPNYDIEDLTQKSHPTPGLVKLSELKSSALVGKSAVPDSLMTQREEIGLPEEASEPDAPEEAESKTLRRRGKKSAAGAAGTGSGEDREKLKGRRQRDFDPAAVDEDSEEEKKHSKEKPSASDEVWTQNQQRQLELALQQYPRGTAERWDKIAKMVPGKSKVSCSTGP